MAFEIPHNLILLVSVGIIGSIMGFIIYGLIVGFENIFKDEDEK